MSRSRVFRHIRALLEFGGGVQLLVSLAGSFGLNFATALAVAKLIEPLSTWDYLFVAAVFAAVTPVTFPLSAVALNWGLSQVEKSRRRAILDNPADTARKTIDSLIEDGRRLLDTVPSQFVTPNSAEYHRSRYDHFMRDADAQVSRVAGEWATRCLVVDDRLEAWRGNPVMDGETLREWYASLIKRLGLIRDSLPIGRTKWLLTSYGIDIRAGQTLLAFLNAEHDEDHGATEVERWALAVYNSAGPAGDPCAHLFAPESRAQVTNRAQRIAYVEERVAELERLWGAL